MKHNSILLFFLFSCFSLCADDCIPKCIPLPPQEKDTCRDRAIWEQPVCPRPSGRPISYGRLLEGAVVKVKPYGYAKWEVFWDTRQTVGFREEQVTAFPMPQRLDKFGIDINDHGKWHMTSIESRIGIALYGPKWDGIKTDGLIETDFRGPIENGNASLRLRHAFGRVSWDTGSFLFGQWWHPLFILKCFPHTVSFGIGIPMEPQARDPQLRLTQRWDWFEIIFAFASQRSFASNGPIGISTTYIRNSVTPNIHLQLRGYFGNNVVGIAADYTRLVPRIVSNENVAVNESINSVFCEGFAAFLQPPWSLRMKAFWAQNANDQLLISGFGVKTVQEETDKRTYSNTAAVGAWLDFSYLFGCDDKELGFFVGGTKNLGSQDRLFIDPETGRPIIFALTQFGPDIDYVVRFSPRFVYKKDPIRLGVEVDYSRASFGKPDACGRVRNGIPVNNARIIIALYYMF